VKSLVQFYETPTGQHFSSVEIELGNDLGEAAIQLGREHIAEINKEFCGEHPELQGKISLLLLPNRLNSSRPTDLTVSGNQE
jgi:hypothetical protein